MGVFVYDIVGKNVVYVWVVNVVDFGEDVRGGGVVFKFGKEDGYGGVFKVFY